VAKTVRVLLIAYSMIPKGQAINFRFIAMRFRIVSLAACVDLGILDSHLVECEVPLLVLLLVVRTIRLLVVW